MTKLCFTICSNNYLAQAKSLGDSLLLHNPDYQFIICLVDKLSEEIDYSFFYPHQILPVEQVPIAGFDEMIIKYDITELNTAVKPFVFRYLFDRDDAIATITFLDPDIIVYDKFDEIEEGFTENTFILTPHFTTAINDNFQLSEEAVLNCGLYNLGFLGLNRKGRVFEFLDWWMERLKDRCFINLEKGWFVDQIWVNLVPLYYEDTFIMRHPGYNMAYWNLHERTLGIRNERYYVNEAHTLVFYHFSGYSILTPAGISKYQDRFTFETRPDLISLFKDYSDTVLQNKHEQFSAIPCHYAEIHRKVKEAVAAAAYEAQVKAEMQAKAEQLEMMRLREKASLKLTIKSTLRRVLHLNN